MSYSVFFSLSLSVYVYMCVKKNIDNKTQPNSVQMWGGKVYLQIHKKRNCHHFTNPPTNHSKKDEKKETTETRSQERR